MTDPRNEELAKLLLERDSSQWPGELSALRVEKRRMPADLRAKLDKMTRESAAPRVIERAWWLHPGSLAAAAVVLVGFTIGLGVFLSRGTETSITALVSFVSGVVKVDEGNAAVGQRVAGGSQVSVGQRSKAIINVSDGTVSAEIRVQSDSDLSASALKKGQLHFRLDRGAVLAAVTRSEGQEGAERKPGAFAVRTNIAMASVRGTRFSLESDAAKDTRLTAFDGAVEFRRRWAELEDLPSELIDQIELLSEVRRIFVQATTTVTAGSESVIAAGDFTQRARGILRLETVLALPAISGLRGRSNVSDSEIRAARKAFDDAIPSAEERSALLLAARGLFGQPPVVTRVPEEVLEERHNRLEQMSDEERDARYSQLQRAAQSDPSLFKKEAEKMLGKKPQEILLKNGETIYGSVFGVDGRYKVYTASGIRMIDPADVEEIRFE